MRTLQGQEEWTCLVDPNKVSDTVDKRDFLDLFEYDANRIDKLGNRMGKEKIVRHRDPAHQDTKDTVKTIKVIWRIISFILKSK